MFQQLHTKGKPVLQVTVFASGTNPLPSCLITVTLPKEVWVNGLKDVVNKNIILSCSKAIQGILNTYSDFYMNSLATLINRSTC
jgi:hypothetical protein